MHRGAVCNSVPFPGAALPLPQPPHPHLGSFLLEKSREKLVSIITRSPLETEGEACSELSGQEHGTGSPKTRVAVQALSACRAEGPWEGDFLWLHLVLCLPTCEMKDKAEWFLWPLYLWRVMVPKPSHFVPNCWCRLPFTQYLRYTRHHSNTG